MDNESARSTALRSAFEPIGALFPALWAGMVLGVSFIATPAKFLASSLGTRTAFDVGRATFELFNTIEVGLSIVLLALVLYDRKRVSTAVLTVCLLTITATQAFVLLPVLSDRVSAIVAGFGVPPSNVHSLYVFMEITKIGLLVAVASRWAHYGFGITSRDRSARRYTWASR